MNKEMLIKMLAGLSTQEEKVAALTAMGITDATLVAELTAVAAPAATVAVQAPAISQPAPVAPATQPVEATAAQAATVAGIDVNALQQRLAAERTARITAECTAFMAANASKITPAEAASVKQLYTQLASMDDPAALNQYAATIQARPANPMLTEQVANGQVHVLGNSNQVDTRTEAEKEAALVSAMLAATPDGQQAAKAMKEGLDTKPAFKQFALATEV
jgi:hypothetical protein